ncbi:MAG: extracellular solute-binding protein [Pirellulales bacterium]|nr:extracellular solute-binding protein [Pirellulales bacterium]
MVFLAWALAAAGLIGGCRPVDGPEVVVYVAVDRGSAEPILRRFEAESGIRVRPVYDAEAAKTTGLVTRLLSESDRPRCDVFWNNELVQTLLLADRDLLAPYEPAAAAALPASWRDAAGRWTPVGTRARVIVYNTKYVSPEQLPRSLFDLTKLQWRGKVAMANPQFGTTRTHVAALFASLGPERAQRLLSDLLANEIRIVDGNALVKNLVARAHPDASPIYLGLTDTDDVLAGKAAGEPVGLIYPDQDAGALGTLVIPCSVGMIRGAPHPEAARRLIDYLTGPEVESRLAAEWPGFFPLRPDAAQQPDGAKSPRAMQVNWPEVLKQLQPSSQWTKEHFHP